MLTVRIDYFISTVVNKTRWKFSLACCCVLSFLLNGCGGTSDSSDQEYDLDHTTENASPETNKFVDRQLLQHISELESNMKNFSQFFMFQDQEMKLPDRQLLTTHQYVLNRHVFIDWSGPVEQLLNDLSKLTGYRAQVIGATPCIPPIVTLHHHHMTVLDVIRDAALQVYKKADLVIYPDENLIELRYK